MGKTSQWSIKREG